MGKNIVICIDGTGNSPLAGYETNILRIFNICKESPKQIKYYHPGIGTLAVDIDTPGIKRYFTKYVLEQGFGWGTLGIIKDVYEFLSKNYIKGDKVYLFGFSRGGYAAIALTIIIEHFGLLKKNNIHLWPYIVELYTQLKNKDFTKFRHRFSSPCPIEFLGLFDPVAFEGILYRKELPNPYLGIVSKEINKLSNCVKFCAQALSIHEKRFTFQPYLFSKLGEPSLNEVWFAGAHSDIGGGYPNDDRAILSLHWMLKQAKGLEIFPNRFSAHRTKSVLGIHNSYNIIWSFLGGKKVREIPDGSNLHSSALQYINKKNSVKIPPLPKTYKIVK